MKGVGGFRLAPDVLAKYAGAYQFSSGREAVITVDAPTLILKLSGRPAQTFTLAAESETMFVSTGFGERAEFAKDTGGAIADFTFTTGTGLGAGNRPASAQKGGPHRRCTQRPLVRELRRKQDADLQRFVLTPSRRAAVIGLLRVR